MDYTTDAMGNYQGDYGAVDPYADETEEQRRLRLQREAQAAAQTPAPPAPVAPTVEKPRPVKQTITTDPRTGQQTMKIEGSVEDLSAANPNTPTVMPPNFDRMLQVESGNRDFDAQGRPIVSPKGARYAAQVMPATARDPGFGVRPAADDSPAESNRVGQDYYQAMLNKYPGQPELARAAYNAGPGAVDAAIKKSMMQGGSPLDYLPKETQGYVQKTGGQVRMENGKVKVGAPAQQQPAPEPVVTAQQLGSQTFPMTAAPAPVAPAEPEPMAAPEPQSPYSLASGQPSQGLQMPDQAPSPAAMPTAGALPAAQQRFQEIQDDPGALLAYRNDTAVPENLRRRAGERATELLNTERNLSRAEARRDELIASGDGKAIANAMQGRGAKGEEGSWLKFVFLRAIDNRMADVEAEKLGLLPSKYEQSTIANADGTQTAIEIKKSSSGKVQEAYRMDGTPLTTKELNTLNSGANLDIVGGTYVNDATGEVGRVVTDKKNPTISYVQTDKGRKPLTGFRPQSSGGSLEQQNVTQQQQLTNKLHYEPAIAAASKGASTLAEYNAREGTNFAIAGRDSLGRPLVVDQRSNQMLQAPPAAPPATSGGSAPAVQSTAPVSPNAMPGVSGSTPGARDRAAEQLKAEQQAARDVGTAEQKQFVEKVMPEIQKKGEDGKFIADTRRTQVGMLTGTNSAIMGIYRGSGTGYDKARAVIRDAVSGAYSGEEGGVKLSEDLRGISIPEEQLSALKEFTQLNTGINAKTLAENAGEGPKSDADMRLNQAANMTNIGDLPAYAALTGLTRSQFAGDINKRKQDFLNANRDTYKTQSQLEGAWSKEKDMLNRQYESIYRARLNYIDAQMVQKFGQDWRKKPNDDTQAFYRNASIHSFNVLPTPNYDVQTQKFVYPTQQSKIAAMRAITGK